MADSWSTSDPTGVVQQGTTTFDRTNSALSYVDIRQRPSAGNSPTGGAPTVTYRWHRRRDHKHGYSHRHGLTATPEIVDGTTSDVLERTYRIYKIIRPGAVTVCSLSVTDDAGNANVVFNRSFTVNAATADVTNPPAGQIIGYGRHQRLEASEVTFRRVPVMRLTRRQSTAAKLSSRRRGG